MLLVEDKQIVVQVKSCRRGLSFGRGPSKEVDKICSSWSDWLLLGTKD